MRISDLRECVLLADTLNFTRTAQRLYTTQSAVSKHIQALEAELDVSLFMRSQHGVHLTKAGRVFVSSARNVVRRYDEMIVAMSRLKYGVDETLSVGYLSGASFVFLPTVANRFSDLYPNIEVQFLTMEIDGINKGLSSGVIDMGISTELIKFSTSRYNVMPLYKDYIRVIVPRDHRLAEKDEVSVSDLEGETILLANPSFMVNEAPIISNYLSPVVGKITIKENVNDITALFLQMMTGRYVTVFFDHVRNFYDFDQHFVFLPLKEAPQGFDVVAVWKKSATSECLVDLARTMADVVSEMRSGGN